MPLKKILRQYNIKPSKKLGQNFLTDKSILKKIIEAANLKPTDVVLEVGPGFGVLTLDLAKHVKKIIAVEKDKKMVEIVRNVLADRNVKNVEIIHSDILKILIKSFKLEQVPREREQVSSFKVVANIPYYLTSPLIRKFLESDNPPELLMLMVQKEVAQRICAKPPKMTLLSVAVQFYAEPKIISYVSKKSFWPQPKVDSAIIRITPRIHPSVIARSETTKQSRAIPMELPRSAAVFSETATELVMTKDFHKHFFSIVRTGFSQPRKQIINNLSKGLNLNREKTKEILKKAGIKPTQRPSELSVDKWMDLAWIMRGK